MFLTHCDLFFGVFGVFMFFLCMGFYPERQFLNRVKEKRTNAFKVCVCMCVACVA